MMLISKIMTDLIGVFIFFAIFGFVNAEICSVYNNILSSESYEEKYLLSGSRSQSLLVEIKFECDTLILNADNISRVTDIQLIRNDYTKIYASTLNLIDENSILNVSFSENILPGRYFLYLSCNPINSSPVISEWFVLTNFDDNNLDKTNNETVRIWLRKSALGHGKYLLENAQNLLRAFKEFTGVAYNENKFVKLDLFVVSKSPTWKYDRRNFIYVDEKIFINEENFATDNNEKLFRSIAGIMVNQAFKNYNFYKLSEIGIRAFFLKEYLTYYITDKAIKTWHLMDLYAYKQRFRIFDDDFAFNRFTFDNGNHFLRGGFIIRMIVNIIGDYNFENYLRGRNGTKISALVSNEIEKIDGDGKFIEQAMKSWRMKGGYPIVMIKREYKANRALVTQQYFLKDINATQPIKYWVPLNFASEDNADFNNTTVTQWLDPKVETIEIAAPLHNKWLICNKQQFGFYRVNYDEKNWKLIIKYLKSKNYQKINVLNRAQLIDDAFVLAEFGYLNFNIAFNLARYLKVETEYIPWETFWEKMFRLFQYSSVSSTTYYEPFKNMILEVSGPMERKFLSNEKSDPNDRMERRNRISFIKWTCFYGSTLSCNYSLKKLKNWLENPVQNPLLEDVRGEIMCSGIRTADEETWYKLLKKFQSNKDKNILFALMCSSKYELLEDLIMMFIDGQLIQLDPWYFMLTLAQKSSVGLDAIIRFVENKQEAIHKMANNYHYYSQSDFRNERKEIPYIMNFRKWLETFCSVIEQFATNHQQLDKMKLILNNNLDTLGLKNVAERFFYTEMKVRNATFVFNSMENYWKA